MSVDVGGLGQGLVEGALALVQTQRQAVGEAHHRQVVGVEVADGGEVGAVALVEGRDVAGGGGHLLLGEQAARQVGQRLVVEVVGEHVEDVGAAEVEARLQQVVPLLDGGQVSEAAHLLACSCILYVVTNFQTQIFLKSEKDKEVRLFSLNR